MIYDETKQKKKKINNNDNASAKKISASISELSFYSRFLLPSSMIATINSNINI